MEQARDEAQKVTKPDFIPDAQYRPPAPIVEWIESHCFDPETVNRVGKNWDFSRAKLIRLEPTQKAILRHVLTPDEQGRFPYREIIWSQIKKSGKTSLAGFVGAWYAQEVEPPNLILCAANDQEQSAGRIFAAMGPTLYGISGRFPQEGSMPIVRLPNGTIVKAIPKDYAGEAGANYGLTLWSELWAYTSERAQRLFEELVPVLTRRNSIRWIETYAGFEDESELLLKLFLLVFKDASEQELQPEAERVILHDEDGNDLELPCYARRDLGLFMFWDHERRMPWQKGAEADKYYEAEKKKGRASTYIRLHENRWQKSEGTYLEPEWVRRAFKPELSELNEPMIFAADGSIGRKQGVADTTALVGVKRFITFEEGGKINVRYRTGYVRIWEIPTGEKIDLDATLGAELRGLAQRNLIIWPVHYDPYQLHQVMLNFENWGVEKGIQVKTEEFNQGTDRLLADSLLYKLYRDDQIDNYEHTQLRAHLDAARAIEDRGQRMRIVKQTVTKGQSQHVFKIDGAVSQSMAIYRASLEPLPSPPPMMKVVRRTAEEILGL